MVGFRKESFYIEKYGEEVGKQRYQKVIDNRLVRSTRRTISDGEMVTCEICNKSMKRITRTHLSTHNISTKEYIEKYPNSLIISENLKKLYRNTEESIIEKYGENLGSVKWKNYQETQAETNTFEYKAKKYNMSKEEFDNYNKERSCTLRNFIKRHGEGKGIDLWHEYCDRQRYTTTIEYFIEKYGTEEGVEKYNKFCLDRNLSNCKQSKRELLAFEELKSVLTDLQLSVRLENKFYGPFDYGNLERKKLIEFYGTYWHADPRFYDENKFHLQRRMTCGKIRSRDQAKRTFALNSGYSVFILWEHDWHKNRNIMLEKLKEFWNE